MVDTVTKKVRSRIMSRIRGKNTRPEQIMRAYLKSRRFKFYEHQRIRGYRVDFVIPSRRIALFVDGCFWHACPQCFKKPKSNTNYWNKKIKDNCKRDKRINRIIRKEGYSVKHIWEHQVKLIRTKAI